ncbi:bifunctional demethylmenaquinone methyltransferase/2-methoxy-6-polyprenyl-1,4-benzoquinol methylase UbiE [Rufibacter glacialis]|uniref:Demethylmenaquinone methyltransferase n=1 Tax=Rufibacter glacialis TaxID=1259555 RepID=A0A5M8QLQ2_9BACT|nr:bifunctional demethylmenaquinone methyltransferase/2-methoxy-6-polyprenyl-1,4-benzoquinol methylase UbiE [Rufibacter glacialis]KAA6435696.1 bifunctional demethylmenaquinone methyltransferase/2-methoxy-6-polyprenyl-1,4-benzoquinol methylase UbiE [Rufibacter glacialis]GGK65748.1 demethylmenaquinone methyltransferase [Rufibacter glacialis]
MSVVPYKDQEEGKKKQVAQMFNSIAKRYDFLNHFLSAGVDIYWRKRAVKLLKRVKPQLVLDIATGTGDFALETLQLKPKQIIGIDISEGMLQVGREKINKRGLSHLVQLQLGDSENIQFPDNHFDAITVAFGVRNFENLEKGLAEMYRVLKPGGMAVILEFSKPQRFPMKQGYNFYFKHILPVFGKMISKDNAAYTYLPESVQAFPDGNDFLAIFKRIGFKNTEWHSLTFGISSIYSGTK